MKIQVGDQIIVKAGKDKNKIGKVLRTLIDKNKVVVEKINLKWRHIKKSQGKPGQKIQFEAPLNASNVMLLCPKTNKATRVNYKKLNDGKKVRVSQKSKLEIVKEITKKSK